jgi:uncharacterized protein (DUF2336 family)
MLCAIVQHAAHHQQQHMALTALRNANDDLFNKSMSHALERWQASSMGGGHAGHHQRQMSKLNLTANSLAGPCCPL